jgi:hypothetical protein
MYLSCSSCKKAHQTIVLGVDAPRPAASALLLSAPAAAAAAAVSAAASASSCSALMAASGMRLSTACTIWSYLDTHKRQAAARVIKTPTGYEIDQLDPKHICGTNR